MKRFSLILALCLLAVAAQAQLLWKVSGNGLARPSYIMGTHHMAPASMIDEIAGMDIALEGCDIVVGEIEKDSLMGQEYAIVEQVFDKYFGAMGVKLSQMKMLKPNAISTQLQAMQALKYFPNFDANNLIDVAVQERANALGKPSAGLETLQEQIDLLFNTPLTEQAEGLLEACKQDDKFLEQSVALSEAYATQNLDRILTVITESTEGEDKDEALDALLYERNRAWVPKLVEMMPERACLVCVGAGHLPGPQGVLQLLRDRGYTVEPMQ